MMNTQAEGIRSALEDEGWKLKETESPSSKQYWWVWEIWTFKKDDELLFLSFLIDPQLEKAQSSIWAVAANKKEPTETLEAESGPMLTINKGWKNRLPDFIEEILTIQ